MALIWAVAQALMAAAFGLPQAVAGRVLLGAGEGGAIPAALREAFSSLPNERRAFVTAVVTGGAPLGIASGALFISWAIAAFGWHAAFAMLGAWSVVWCIAWERAAPAASRERGERGERTGSGRHARSWFRWNAPLFGASFGGICGRLGRSAGEHVVSGRTAGRGRINAVRYGGRHQRPYSRCKYRSCWEPVGYRIRCGVAAARLRLRAGLPSAFGIAIAGAAIVGIGFVHCRRERR